MYGTSETLMAFIGQLDLNADSAPIGKPIANTWSYILDENKKPVPIGVLGDLYISRDFMSPGYYNRQDLTDKAFMDNPYSVCEDNKRMYSTGDVAFFNFDGEINILGRTDDQLSVRGFRVESEEIMRIMKEFKSIADIYLDVENDILVAYYTTTGKVDIEEVKKALELELPPYMIPTLFMEMDELPLNFNGKVDKFALRKMAQEMKKVETNIEIDDTILKSVIDKFKEILKVDSVSIDDKFVSLGGNSLSAMKLQLQLKEKLNVNLPSNELMELSTPNNIANAIKANLNTDLNIDDTTYTFDDIVPLSESQLNVYLDENVNEMGTEYNNGFKISLDKSYSIEKIKKAIDKLFESYPVLKARVINNNDIISFSFDAQVDIHEGSPDKIESFIRPFDLDKSLSRFLIVEKDDSNLLFMDCHHLIFDGTSLNIIFNRLTSILDEKYDDFIDNGVLRQISFDESITPQYMTEASQFYDIMLADREEAYDLLPTVDSSNETEFHDIVEIDNNYLTSFLKKNNITHNQFFSSVFAYTLSRFTGSEKVLFNIIENGRGHINLSESVGMFVRTLPLLIDCKKQNIDSFLKKTASLINSTMKYDLYPFRILANNYDLNSSIYFQYAHNLFENTYDLDVVELHHDPFGEFSFFIMNSDENSFRIKVVFSDKYSHNIVERCVNSFKMVLHEMIDKDNLGNINYILENELKLLDSYNCTEHDLKYNDVLDAFNDNLSKYPHKQLVSYKGVSYTYGEGAFIADKIAKKLIELGIGPNDYVSFLTERNEYYILCILAIMSTGAAYVPLDDAHPDERIAFMIKDTSSKVVIVSDETIERGRPLSEDSIFLNISDILEQNVESINSLPVVYGDLACILYTSGTTGVPKGVKITRKSILNISQYYKDTYNMNSDDIYGLYASIGFDVASFGIFSALYVGACLSVVPWDIRLDMDKLNQYYINQQITHTVMTTQVAKLFINHTDKTSLKYLLTGGEKLGEFEGPEDYTLIDVYGPTESFMFINTVVVNEKIDYSSVGFLNYNVKTYILDAEGRRVPFGAVGELYIAGYQVAQGYLNRDEENQKAFLNNPFDSDENYNRLYRTGDIVRYLPDGSLGIVGRQDSQVKIRGNRVELPEIEDKIRELDYIDDVTVQAIKNGNNNEIAAYVVVSDDLKGNTLREDIQNFIGKSKPNYMIPSYVIELDEIPLNVNGKVDKRKLPEITLERRDYEAPEDYFEIVIANVFSEVLNIDKISRNDEFSKLGGDSIDVISLISKLRELNIHITVKDVMDEQTVKRIAKKAEYKISTTEISQEPFEGFVNPTPTTKYFMDLNLKNPSFFHVPCMLETSKKIDENILKKSMMDVVNYHDILRAIVKDGKLFVRPQNDEEIFTIEHCDLLRLNEESERINREIDISNGPLIKLAIFEDEKGDYLYICFHHLLVDSNSLRIIINDLNLAYTQRSHNMETELYSKTSSYQDFALAIDEYKNSNDVLEQEHYWENTLNTLKELNHTKINSDIIKRDSFSMKLPHQISSIIFTNAPKYFDCSIQGLFLSMIIKSWKDITGENEVSIRLNQNERMNFNKNISIERTVGWLDSFYPVILKYQGENNKEIIANTEKILSDVPNKGYDYPILKGIETSNIPLIHFSYTNEFNLVGGGKMFNPKHNSDLANFTAPENNFMCDITIYGYTINNETFFKIDYNCERFTKEFMEKFGYAFLKNINSIMSFTREDYSGDAYIFSDLPDKKKLFFIHSANFGSEYFYYMAQKLKDEYSFIVLEPYNRNHKENQLSSIEEFAEKYIEIMKSIQPEGPYYIGGYCYGGIIAHEMAVQLKKQNENVDKLILFESYYIDDELKELAIEEQALYARDFLKDGILNPKHETIEDMISYALSSVNILHKYKPSYYDGDAIYFKAAIRTNEIKNDIFRRLDDFFHSKKAGGYEDFYNKEKFKVICVPVGHDYLLNAESLKIIIPELIKFIEGRD